MESDDPAEEMVRTSFSDQPALSRDTLSRFEAAVAPLERNFLVNRYFDHLAKFRELASKAGDWNFKDDNEAISFLKPEANQGDARAQINLGVLYMEGIKGIPKDEQKALYKELPQDLRLLCMKAYTHSQQPNLDQEVLDHSWLCRMQKCTPS